jgi:hypothetical protein
MKRALTLMPLAPATTSAVSASSSRMRTVVVFRPRKSSSAKYVGLAGGQILVGGEDIIE